MSASSLNINTPPPSWNPPPAQGGLRAAFFSPEDPVVRKARKWKQLTPAEREAIYKPIRNAAAAARALTQAEEAAAAASAAEVAAFTANDEAGRTLRLRHKFNTEVVSIAFTVLEKIPQLTIPFLVGGANTHVDISAVINDYIENDVDPPEVTEASAMDAANQVTKEQLIRLLLTTQLGRELHDILEEVKFDTKSRDGKLNLRAGTKPYAKKVGDDAAADARLIQLLTCCYTDKAVLPCIKETKTVYAYMTLRDEIEDTCLTGLITEIVRSYPPGQELCEKLRVAADNQRTNPDGKGNPSQRSGGVGAAPAAAAGGGGAAAAVAPQPEEDEEDQSTGGGGGSSSGGGSGSGGAPRERQGGGSRYPRQSRRKGRKGRRGSRRR